jgi:hypothetical protein
MPNVSTCWVDRGPSSPFPAVPPAVSPLLPNPTPSDPVNVFPWLEDVEPELGSGGECFEMKRMLIMAGTCPSLARIAATFYRER